MNVLTLLVSCCIIVLMMFVDSVFPSMLPPPLPWMACRRSSGEFVSAYTLTKWGAQLAFAKRISKSVGICCDIVNHLLRNVDAFVTNEVIVTVAIPNLAQAAEKIQDALSSAPMAGVIQGH
jgi:hypothetical protein